MELALNPDVWVIVEREFAELGKCSLRRQKPCLLGEMRFHNFGVKQNYIFLFLPCLTRSLQCLIDFSHATT